MTGGATAATECGEHISYRGSRGPGAEIGRVIAVLAMWSDSVPMPAVADVADLPSSRALRHLRHLAHCRPVGPMTGGHRATPPALEAVESSAVGADGWSRAAQWHRPHARFPDRARGTWIRG